MLEFQQKRLGTFFDINVHISVRINRNFQFYFTGF